MESNKLWRPTSSMSYAEANTSASGVDENGIPRFQRFQKQPIAPTLYYVFDVLLGGGEDITGKPIVERRRVLERIIKAKVGIQLGAYIGWR